MLRPCLVALLALSTVPAAGGQANLERRDLKAPEVMESLRLVRGYTELGLSREFRISGEVPFDGQVLTAETIVFAPGSRLVLSGSGPLGDRSERYVVARTLRVIPGTPPPVITWARDPAVSHVPKVLAPQKPDPGPIGGVDGAPGGPGTDGQTGNPGYPGRSAPTLFVLVARVEGGPLQVDIRGQDGGAGGEGQPGGDGGSGRSGHPGISGFIDCRSGGQDGGPGGKGGNGGTGGAGGRGGSGGTLVLLSTQPPLAAAQELFEIDVSPGKGGPGGAGGKPGDGGPGGLGGRGSGFCGGGHSGESGLPASGGLSGASGPDGVPGLFATTVLTDVQLQRALGGR